MAEHWAAEARERFTRLLREELGAEVHGEVDERSWHLKQSLLRRQSNVRNETKLFRDYARQSFEDTLTLYLHGTCCDIDVETGPRQMPSRYLRKRLELLECALPAAGRIFGVPGAAKEAVIRRCPRTAGTGVQSAATAAGSLALIFPPLWKKTATSRKIANAPAAELSQKPLQLRVMVRAAAGREIVHRHAAEHASR